MLKVISPHLTVAAGCRGGEPIADQDHFIRRVVSPTDVRSRWDTLPSGEIDEINARSPNKVVASGTAHPPAAAAEYSDAAFWRVRQVSGKVRRVVLSLYVARSKARCFG